MTRPLTVAQILPRLDAGGVERGAVEVAEALVTRGRRAIVISAGGAMAHELQALGAEHIQLPVAAKNPLTLRAVRPLRRLLREQRVDILHARSRVPAWVSLFAWRGMAPNARPRFITTVHGLHSVSAYSAVMTKGEAVVAVSRAAERYIYENYPKAPRERVRVIHRGVDPSEFPHAFRPSDEWLRAWESEFPHLIGKHLVTIIGRLTRLKGHHDFLHMIAQLRDPNAHGVIVGGEDPRRLAYARELRERVRSEGIENRVTFTGHRSDAREIASISDIAVSLSTKPESFGRSVLEALRLGTPVLGWDHGGVGEVLGAIYPQGAVPLADTGALVTRANELLGAPKHLVPPSEMFTKREMLDKILGLYEELASR